MRERVKERLAWLLDRSYRKSRATVKRDITAEFRALPPMQARVRLLAEELSDEVPVLYGDDLFGFNFSRAGYAVKTGDEIPNNVTIDYEGMLESGLDGIRARIDACYGGADETAREFYDAIRTGLDLFTGVVGKYREAAAARGLTQLAEALGRVPEHGARNYYEALVTLRFLQYSLRKNHNNHITLGRFDKYMRPYYAASRAAGASVEDLTELTELFFIALNIDADLYGGVQQGDNGQSLMLGGVDENGEEVFNEISEICLTASEELKIIDPKINLRVNKNTPLSLYERGTKLTKVGLGFPQYSNDDVVIPALVKWGYDPEDARDYTVAACWEFIIPRYGAEKVNVDKVNLPLAVDRAVHRALTAAKSFDEFLSAVDEEIAVACDEVVERRNRFLFVPDPWMSAFLLPCIERGRDLAALGAKYNNYGVHGVGIASAADALAAIEKVVFEEKSVPPERLIAALDADFEGENALRERLLACPKMGNNDDYADSLGNFVMQSFARHLGSRKNNRGGIYRPGTGTAMEYILSAANVGATADGRKAHQPFASGFTPSLEAKPNGPLSAILSFTKYDVSGLCNGGPFTIEIHDTVFRNDEGEKKVAMLVKAFIDNGGHQIQINAINRDILLDAQKNPDKYPNLIVRVWGWSGYFRELDTCYQNHIIKRVEYTFG